MLTVQQALEKIIETIEPAQTTTVTLEEALGCTLAEDVFCPEDSPPFAKSMMDGYAVLLSDLSNNEPLPVISEVTAGQVCDQSLQPGTAIRIMTGAPVPEGTDLVVPVEECRLEEDRVRINATRPWQAGANIVPRGQEMRSGEKLLRAGEGIRPQEIALLAEIGVPRPLVRRPPRIAVLATGDELVAIDQTPGPGQIRNSNAAMLTAQAKVLNADVHDLGICRDVRADLADHIRRGLESDFFCLSGGVSAGKLDLVPSELAEAGVEQVFHKVAFKPGKPIWFGIRRGGEGKPCYVFGLPGNPVSSMVCFELFVRAAVRCFLGIHPPVPVIVQAQLACDFKHRSSRPTWFPAKLLRQDSVLLVQPVNWQGSFDLKSAAQANCSLILPEGEQSFSQGQTLEALPWGATIHV